MINRRLHNCNNYIIGSTEPDMYFDEASLLCVPSRNDPRMVFRYEESLVGQLLVLAIFFVIFDYSLPKIREAFDGFYRRHGFYNADRMSHLGYFAPIKTELKFDSGGAFHHLIAGLFMLAGWMLNGQTLLFRLGVLMEVSCELIDIRDLILRRGLWAYNFRADACLVMLAHHLPGIGLILPLNLWCSCVDTWQRIAIAMELGGAILLVVSAIRKVVDDNPLTYMVLDIIALDAWIWARFVIAMPLMLELIRTGLEFHCRPTYALIVGGGIMNLFNLMVVIDFLLKIAASVRKIGGRYGKRKIK